MRSLPPLLFVQGKIKGQSSIVNPTLPYPYPSTFARPVSRVSFAQVLCQDDGAQRVPGRQQRRAGKALPQLAHRLVHVVGERRAVAPRRRHRQACICVPCIGSLISKYCCGEAIIAAVEGHNAGVSQAHEVSPPPQDA